MPKFAKGNIFESGFTPIVTTNGVITRSNGVARLVMGLGAALEAKKRYVGIDILAAEWITEYITPRPDGTYHYHPLFIQPYKIGLFQVKYHYRERADLSLIERSSKYLAWFADLVPTVQFALNYPGIGAGDRTKAEIEPIIAILPNNVTVFEL